MANHRFVCDKCNEEVFDTNSAIVHKCSICGDDMRWDLSPSFRSKGDFYHESRSMGCPAGQVDEMRKKFPGSEYKKRGQSYVLVTRSVKEMDKRLSERGMVRF